MQPRQHHRPRCRRTRAVTLYLNPSMLCPLISLFFRTSLLSSIRNVKRRENENLLKFIVIMQILSELYGLAVHLLTSN